MASWQCFNRSRVSNMSRVSNTSWEQLLASIVVAYLMNMLLKWVFSTVPRLNDCVFSAFNYCVTTLAANVVFVLVPFMVSLACWFFHCCLLPLPLLSEWRYCDAQHLCVCMCWAATALHAALVSAAKIMRCIPVLSSFYLHDAMLARVFATATCLSVCHMPVLCLVERKQDREMYTIW